MTTPPEPLIDVRRQLIALVRAQYRQNTQEWEALSTFDTVDDLALALHEAVRAILLVVESSPVGKAGGGEQAIDALSRDLLAAPA